MLYEIVPFKAIPLFQPKKLTVERLLGGVPIK